MGQTLYRWDGAHVLTIPDEPWWRFESAHRHGIAYGLLYHVTADPELAERRAKAFTAEVLDPLAGAPSSIVSSAVEAWLVTSPPRLIRERPRVAPTECVIPCAGCEAPLSVHPRHLELLRVFGTWCTSCREVPA